MTLTLRSFRDVAAACPTKRRASPLAPEEIAAVVGRVARFVPGATCLTQAAAAHYLLALYGHQSLIRVGVKPDTDNRFTAHAWLLHNDSIILGGNENMLAGYKVLTDLEPHTSP